MPNYVRACFCVEEALDQSHLQDLIKITERFGCQPVDAPVTNMDRWVDQFLVLKMLDKNWEARLFQLSSTLYKCCKISFDVEDSFFLPGRKISAHPRDDKLFITYKRLLLALIQELKPFIGVIDWDADLLCGEIGSNLIAGWGNYLSNQLLNNWSVEELRLVPDLVDEYIPVQGIGILTFNHPLGSGDTYKTHLEFYNLIKTHMHWDR
jgi:hypothetical protein